VPGGLFCPLMKRFDRERGAVAVEFALVLPALLLLVLGMIEFSRAYNTQLSITNAAREGAREMAVHDDPVAAQQAAVAAAPTVGLTTSNVAVTPSSCSASPTSTVKVTITYSLSLITGWFGPTLPLQGIGAMQCGG